jgi:dolichol-phosphate mannosyltransferase
VASDSNDVQNSASTRVLVAVFVFNEGEKLRHTLSRFPSDRNYDIVVMDDGSTDDVTDVLKEFPFGQLRHDVNQGVGASIRTVCAYALENDYDVLAMIAGNGKMEPGDIPGLLRPILEEGYDFVQGSRYLMGARSENLPLFRRVAIPVFTWIVQLVAGYRTTDATCGLRAFRLDLLRHPDVDISQTWLDRYEMEYYLVYKTIKLGHRIAEAPASMVYPDEKKNYTKIQPLVGWWSMMRPWVYLRLGLKK